MRADVVLELLAVLPHRLDGVHGQRLLPPHRQLADRQRQLGVDLGAMKRNTTAELGMDGPTRCPSSPGIRAIERVVASVD